MVHETYFWYYLLKICENLRELEPDSKAALEETIAQLETMNESFRKCFDPVDELEKYAVLEFSKCLEDVLAAQRTRLLPDSTENGK